MRVQLLDPSAFTPPYDHSLAGALSRAGAEVELVTSPFLYGPVPEANGYTVTESFYRRTAERGLEAKGRRVSKLAEHFTDMARWRRSAAPDVTHHQWLTLPSVDPILLPKRSPQLITAHYIASPEAGRRELAVARRAFGSMDAVVAHSRSGARRLVDTVGIDAGRVHVIPHGAFEHLTHVPGETPLPTELAAVEGPVILFFGLVRPYKGVDLLIEAFAGLEGAELWVVGNPRMDMAPLHDLAARAKGKVRFVSRFITDPEIAAYFRRADIVALPYRDIEQSGVLYTGLAFGRAMVLSDVGGFGEVVEETGAGRLVPSGDVHQLRAVLRELLADDGARERLAAAARRAASGAYSWDEIGRRTFALYEELLG